MVNILTVSSEISLWALVCPVVSSCCGLRPLLIQSAHEALSVCVVAHEPFVQCWLAAGRDAGAVAAVIETGLNYICLHKPFQHGNQILSAGLLSALWLVSRGSRLQRSCTKLKYPLYGKMTPIHTKWLMAENQTIAWEETQVFVDKTAALDRLDLHSFQSCWRIFQSWFWPLHHTGFCNI